MSAAFFNQLADPELARGISAGTQPAEHVLRVVVDAMHEVGIDLSKAKPQKLTAKLAQNAEMLVTMGCGDECPYIPGLRRDDWPLPDPKGKGLNRYGRPGRDRAAYFAVACTGEVESNIVSGVTLVWMLAECGVSLYGAISAHSPVLLAFGADSFVELLSATVALLAIIPSFPLTKDRAARLAGPECADRAGREPGCFRCAR